MRSEITDDWLTTRLDAEAAEVGDQPHNPWKVLRDRRVLSLALFFLCFPLATDGLAFWLPTIVEGFGGLSGFAVGAVSAIPYVCVMAGLLVVPRLARRRGSPFGWLALMLGLFAAQPVMWGLVPRFLSGAVAAAGICAINGIGNLGGGFGPMGIAAVVASTGSALTGLVFLVVVSVLGMLGTVGLRRVLTRGSRAESLATR